ncbi:MAG: pseudouridine synthase [Chloroflexota bacterium]
MTAERIQKVLAASGVASRRKAEELIAAERVTVNGVPAVVGQRISVGRDTIAVDGRPLASEHELVYLALNKPAGVVTSTRSTHGEHTVAELVDFPERIFPVGRLDRETTGLLLLTNDGEWANLVTHPRYGVEKEYELMVRGIPPESVLQRLRDGVRLPDGTLTSPARVGLVRPLAENAHLSVTVIEGKKRQIRLMAATVGFPALYLTRIRIGAIELGDLAAGQQRNLTQDEVEGIREHARRSAGSGT